MSDFEQLVQNIHEYNLNKEYAIKESLEYKSKVEFTNFSVWCIINELQPTEANFKTYLNQNNKEIDFWIKKCIFENYFNYEFTYDYDTNKWSAKHKDAI